MKGYYPFGMMMPGRKYTAGLGYRYGFNGKENDNDVKGEGNQQDYGMRIYDPRLGKFLSVDPLTQEFPFYTPYQFAGNKPIYALDLDGAEELPYVDQYQYNGSWGLLDRLKAVPNAAGKIYNHAVAGTWNSAVSNVRSLGRGTWTEDMGNELNQMGSAIKNEAVSTYDYHTSTSAGQQAKDFGKFLTNPERGEDILEFGFGAYTGSKLVSGKGNLLARTSARTNTEQAAVKTEVATTKSLPNPYSRFSRFEKKYGDHSNTFGTSGNLSRQAYYNRAIKLADAKVEGDILGFTSKGNTTFKLNKRTGDFIVINPDGKISSFYRRVADPVKYLEDQKIKYGVKESK